LTIPHAGSAARSLSGLASVSYALYVRELRCWPCPPLTLGRSPPRPVQPPPLSPLFPAMFSLYRLWLLPRFFTLRSFGHTLFVPVFSPSFTPGLLSPL
jgi:hypothetical protein